MTEMTIHTEQIDDIPLLFSFLQQMGIQETLDAYANPHGNRHGLSIGWLTTAWLSYIVSESDHRMIEVESWAEKHIETLSALIPQAVNIKDFTDDRLADLLQCLSKDMVWEEVENRLADIRFRFTIWIKNQSALIALQPAFITTQKVTPCSVTDTAKTTDQICRNSR